MILSPADVSAAHAPPQRHNLIGFSFPASAAAVASDGCRELDVQAEFMGQQCFRLQETLKSGLRWPTPLPWFAPIETLKCPQDLASLPPERGFIPAQSIKR